MQTKEVVRYVKGETIRDTVPIEEPIHVEVPTLPKLPIKRDTVYIDNIRYITEEVDTSAIIQDYILTRTYEFNVFNNDTLGMFDVKQKIGYNKLLSFDYIFTPITKQITQLREPVFTPFITMGYSTNQSVSLGGGLYYKRIGVEYNMNISNQNYHTFKLNYKL